jgi:putative hydrolase of the HAD superfamily
LGQHDYLLLIDADDTLWESALFFQRTEEDFINLMSALGVSADDVRGTVHRRDIERLSVTGYGAEPYMDTLDSILREYVPEPPDWAVTSLEDMRRCLLGHPVVLTPGAVGTLKAISGMPFYSVVYTMGEEIHQRDKFLRSGLNAVVDELTIVPEKTVDSLREILRLRGFAPERTILVGNSPRSDINPATTLGLSAVFLQRELTWSLEHEEFSHPHMVVEINDFNELLKVLDNFLDKDASMTGRQSSASEWRCRQ